MNLLRYLKNRQKVKENYPCMKILGSKSTVASFGKFWENNGSDLMAVVAAKLLDYTEDENFTKEELIAFKKGLGAISEIFPKCWAETEQYKE